MLRRAALTSLVALPLLPALAGCGNTAPAPVARPVRLTLQAPAPGSRVDSSTISVSGTVSPARARVLVLGRPVRVARGGAFETKVPLAVGPNLIDVIAGAPHARAAMTALNVVRYELVRVPSVTGRSPQAAAAALRAAGLAPRTRSSSNPFSFLLPLPEHVCAQSPPAGRRVAPGSTVTVQTGKVCL